MRHDKADSVASSGNSYRQQSRDNSGSWSLAGNTLSFRAVWGAIVFGCEGVTRSDQAPSSGNPAFRLSRHPASIPVDAQKTCTFEYTHVKP